MMKRAAGECELRGGKSCGALAKRRLKCASAWCSAWCSAGRAVLGVGELLVATRARSPAAEGQRREARGAAKSLGARAARAVVRRMAESGRRRATSGRAWARECGMAGNLERLLLLLRCVQGRKLKGGYLRTREASGNARVDGPGRAVGERARQRIEVLGGFWVCKRVRAGARVTRCCAMKMPRDALRCAAMRCDVMRCDAK